MQHAGNDVGIAAQSANSPALVRRKPVLCERTKPRMALDAAISSTLSDKNPALLLRRGSAAEIGVEPALRFMEVLVT